MPCVRKFSPGNPDNKDNTFAVNVVSHPMFTALKHNHAHVAQYFIDKGSIALPIICAWHKWFVSRKFSGIYPLVAAMLCKDANKNRGPNGMTPLHLAYNNTSVSYAILRTDPSQIDAHTGYHRPLQYASDMGNVSVVELLWAYGAQWLDYSVCINLYSVGSVMMTRVRLGSRQIDMRLVFLSTVSDNYEDKDKRFYKQVRMLSGMPSCYLCTDAERLNFRRKVHFSETTAQRLYVHVCRLLHDDDL